MKTIKMMNDIELSNSSSLDKNLFFKVMDIYKKFLNNDALPSSCKCSMKLMIGSGFVPVFIIPYDNVFSEKVSSQLIKETISRMLEIHIITKNKEWDFMCCSLFQSVRPDEKKCEVSIIASVDFCNVFMTLDNYNVLDIENQMFREPTLNGKKLIKL